MAKEKSNGESSPNDNNPNSVFKILMFESIFTGLVYAGLKFGDVETRLAAVISPVLPLDANKATMVIVLLAGVLQNHMASTTNWARAKYDVKWPHTFAPEGDPAMPAQPDLTQPPPRVPPLEGHKDKVAFDCVQRAHLNFVENYTQVLALTYFAAQAAPYWAFLSAFFFLLGRLVFANGYYSGNAENRNAGAFGYMVGKFPLQGLFYLVVAKTLGVPGIPL